MLDGSMAVGVGCVQGVTRQCLQTLYGTPLGDDPLLFIVGHTPHIVLSVPDLKNNVTGKSWVHAPKRHTSHANDARWLVQAVGRAGRSRDGDRCRSGQQAQTRADRAKTELRKRQSECAVPTSLTRRKYRPKSSSAPPSREMTMSQLL